MRPPLTLVAGLLWLALSGFDAGAPLDLELEVEFGVLAGLLVAGVAVLGCVCDDGR